ncbi:MAG: alanine racemase [Clostridia bacterium]|nr:alanine racemase [Clostridia bacterium]
MYRNSYVEINVDNLQHNVKEIIKKYPDYQYYFGVVKGNAYGHSDKVAKYLVESGINYLAISSLEEGISLRKDGITTPILCLEPISISYLKECLEYDITISIPDYEYYQKLVEQEIAKPLKVHIKIDSGMCRLGFTNAQEVKEVVDGLKEKTNIILEGIFTHFATDGIYDVSWDNQFTKFKEITSGIDLSQIPIVHLGRSQTLLNHNKIEFANGIRLGIILYGYNTTPTPLPNNLMGRLRKWKREFYHKKHHISPTITDIDIDLKTAFSLYSEVIQVKKIAKGSFVGYGRIYEAPEDMYVAIIPIGYADGFSRKNKGRQIVIHGKRFSLIGDVNMGMLIAKVDESVQAGDKVTLIGDEIPMREVARYIGTSVYEGGCMLNDWLPRVLIKGGKTVEIDERI